MSAISAHANWSNRQCENQNFLDRSIIGDEARFEMNGKVNTQNVRQYAPKGHPPAFNFDKSSNRDKLTVWAGLCGNSLIYRPYFFEEDVNGRAYLRMLNDFVFPEFLNRFNNQY